MLTEAVACRPSDRVTVAVITCDPELIDLPDQVVMQKDTLVNVAKVLPSVRIRIVPVVLAVAEILTLPLPLMTVPAAGDVIAIVGGIGTGSGGVGPLDGTVVPSQLPTLSTK